MSRKSLGPAAMAIGVAVMAAAALADEIGLGDGGAFGWKQIVGIVLGAVVAASGFVAITSRRKPAPGLDTTE